MRVAAKRRTGWGSRAIVEERPTRLSAIALRRPPLRGEGCHPTVGRPFERRVTELNREKPTCCTRNDRHGWHKEQRSRRQAPHDLSANRKFDPAQNWAEHKSHKEIDARPK